jgi:hypothetical protein
MLLRRVEGGGLSRVYPRGSQSLILFHGEGASSAATRKFPTLCTIYHGWDLGATPPLSIPLELPKARSIRRSSRQVLSAYSLSDRGQARCRSGSQRRVRMAVTYALRIYRREKR